MAKTYIFRNRVLQNFLTVGFIQGLGMLLPLLTIPYLMQVLNPDGFGIISFALAYTTLFVVFTDYGYNLLGTREVALNIDKPEKINKTFTTIFGSQLLLTIVAAAFFFLSVMLVPEFRKSYPVFLATFGIVIGSVLMPTWIFQAFEKFNQLHIITFFYRLIYTIGIFLIINDENDLILVAALNSITHIGGSIFAFLWVKNRFKIHFTPLNFTEIKASLKDGWNLFVSAVAVTSIQQLPIIILSFFVNATIVGYYAFAEKILLLFRIVIQLFSTVVYPKLIHQSKLSYKHVAGLISKMRKFGSVAFFFCGFLIFFLPEFINHYFPQYAHPVLTEILKIWAFLPLLMFLKITYQQVLLTYNHTKQLAKTMMIAGFVNILLLLAGVILKDYRGVAISVLFIELLLIFALMWQVKKTRN